MRRQRLLALGATLALLGAAPMQAMAQEPGRMQQQQMMMQQQMVQEQTRELNRAMERMSQIQMRAQNMERDMNQAMHQLRQNPELAQQNALHLRNQERLQSMAQSMNAGAREMERAMEQLRNMIGEPGFNMDQTMQRDMQQLREHWDGMAGNFEEGLRVMDRIRDQIQDRIHQTDGER